MQSSNFIKPDFERFVAEMPASLTILDTEGRLVFYNAYAPRILDRKPEYLGRDIREFHQPASAAKIGRILDAYRAGGREQYSWRLSRGSRNFQVRAIPWLEDGRWAGVLHLVMLLEE